MENAMTASTCRHADRPLAFTITLGKEVHNVRAHRIHPVGLVLDGSRGSQDSEAGSSPLPPSDLDDYSWGHDVSDLPDGLMCGLPAIRRRQHLTATRACSPQLVAR
jgi:hypothetical protein